MPLARISQGRGSASFLPVGGWELGFHSLVLSQSCWPPPASVARWCRLGWVQILTAPPAEVLHKIIQNNSSGEGEVKLECLSKNRCRIGAEQSTEPVKCRFLPVDSGACGIKQACKHWAFACPLSAVSLVDFFSESFTFAARDYF